MKTIQRGILRDETKRARYLTFDLHDAGQIKEALSALVELVDGESTVVGLGVSVIRVLGHKIHDMRVFPARSEHGIDIPSTPAALWCWLRGSDPGELLHHGRAIEQALSPAFELVQVVDAFQFCEGRDLSGYVDGTENPQGDEAVEAAFVTGRGEGLDGASYVAVQQWVHDLDQFAAMGQPAQDHTIGRRISDNEEIEDAPESAHVKRTAQEDFEPPAFILRRSMPWTEGVQAGLMFIAFGKSLNAYEALLNRMLGTEDGITDALFGFTRPVTGAYYWCPPMRDGALDLRALGL